MKSRHYMIGVATFAVAACFPTEGDVYLERLRLPDGFEISVYAEVPEARTIKLADDGVLYVGNRRAGNVYAAVDSDGDGFAETVYTIASGLTMPNGIAIKNGSLFVAESHRVTRYDDIGNHLSDPPEPVIVVEGLPEEARHGWRYIDFGPDGRLYMSVGAPCNVCERPAPYASIISMNADGSDRKTVARGIRNSVGFNWHPETGELWFTDNGRDNLGDDSPPDELNRVIEEGLHYGFPYVHGGDILDPEFGKGRDPDDYVAPAKRLGPHVAALGIEFYRGNSFPAQYSNQIFIAEHGSWNRTEKIGYRISLVRIDTEGVVTSYETFIDGWLEDEEAWGRPVDLENMPGGSLLISDDKAGVVYKVTYTG
ncbi:MAG: sorbosone dehydrogenase family protein [Rhodothermia bacterium]